jgi:hypothetical protein
MILQAISPRLAIRIRLNIECRPLFFKFCTRPCSRLAVALQKSQRQSAATQMKINAQAVASAALADSPFFKLFGPALTACTANSGKICF